MKSKKIAIIVIVALVIVAIIITLMFKFFKKAPNQPDSNANLVEYSTTYGGDMIGSFESTTVKILENGKVLVSYSNSKWHGQDPEVNEYYVSEGVLDEIRAVYDKYGMDKYGNLGMSNIQVLDAGTTSYHFSFDDGGSINFSDNQKVPVKAYEGLKEIDQIIKNAADNGEKLPGLVIDRTVEEDDDYYNFRVNEGVCKIEVSEYSLGVLRYRIANGFDEDVVIRNDITLVKDDGTKIYESLTEDDSETRDTTITADYVSDESIPLGEDRLEAGTYTLTFGDYECQFEIK